MAEYPRLKPEDRAARLTIRAGNNWNKTGVINDPLGQTHSLASSEHCFLLFCFAKFEKWGRTDGRTACLKTNMPAVTVDWPSGSNKLSNLVSNLRASFHHLENTSLADRRTRTNTMLKISQFQITLRNSIIDRKCFTEWKIKIFLLKHEIWHLFILVVALSFPEKYLKNLDWNAFISQFSSFFGYVNFFSDKLVFYNNKL